MDGLASTLRTDPRVRAHAMSSRTTTHSDNPTATEDLGRAILRDLHGPLAALRATIENLAEELAPQAEARRLAWRALDQVVALDRRAEALAEIVDPTPLRPLDCTVGELVRGAWTSLDGGRRERVWLAIEDAAAHVHVDGPILVRSLACLLEDATACSGTEVLLHAHCEDERVVFAIVLDLEAQDVALPVREHEESLELRLARREVDRLGAELTVAQATLHHRMTLVELRTGAGEERA